jgi:hypothetical protein
VSLSLRVPASAWTPISAVFLTCLTLLVWSRMGPGAALALALVPTIAIIAVLLVGEGRVVLYLAAFAIPLAGIDAIDKTIPFGSANVRTQDLAIVLALGAFVFESLLARSRGQDRRAVPTTPVLGWPLVAFAACILIPLLRGHYSYGASFVGQPLRLIAYAGIAVALAGVTAEQMYRSLMAVFYAGAVAACLWAAYYTAVGGSQSLSVDLSTGGSRPLAISTSLFCAGALFMALLTIRKDPSKAHSILHLGMAGLGLAGVILGFGRGVFASVALVLLILFLVSKGVRRGVLVALPLALPFVALLALLVVRTAPDLVTSFQNRISASPSQDANVIWREKANKAVFEQVRENPVFGVGFGRSSSFNIDVRSSSGFLVPVRQDIEQDPHNGYLYLLAGGGLLALGTWLVILAVFAVDAVRRYRAHAAGSTERLLVAWAGALLFCFLFEAASGTMFENTDDLLAMWALLVLPGVARLPRRSRLGR